MVMIKNEGSCPVVDFPWAGYRYTVMNDGSLVDVPSSVFKALKIRFDGILEIVEEFQCEVENIPDENVNENKDNEDVDAENVEPDKKHDQEISNSDLDDNPLISDGENGGFGGGGSPIGDNDNGGGGNQGDPLVAVASTIEPDKGPLILKRPASRKNKFKTK